MKKEFKTKIIEDIRQVFPDFNPDSLSDKQLGNVYKSFMGINKELENGKRI